MSAPPSMLGPVVDTQQYEQVQKALTLLSALESGGINFFSRVNSAIDKPYEPKQAFADYDEIVQQLEAVEAIVAKLGLSELSIPRDKPLSEILKDCSTASSDAYNSASAVNNRANVAQKALSQTLTAAPSQSVPHP